MNGRPGVRRLMLAATVAVMAVAAVGTAGCGAAAPQAAPPTSVSAPTAMTSTAGNTAGDAVNTTVGTAGDAAATPIADSVPARDAEAVRATIDAINATAGGPVADQQRRLVDSVDPDDRADVGRCPPATTTVRFEPVYAGLRGTGGSADSTSYALPTLIRIYTGSRMTGTDLTTLQLVVRPSDGATSTAAYLTPFCVN